MRFTLDVTDDLRVLRLHEKHLETHAATELKSQLVIMFTVENSKYLAIDLSEVETIDSSGIGAFLLAHRESTSLGGFCLLISIRPRIMDILKMTGLSDQLYIFASLKEAKEQIIFTDEDENLLSDFISLDILEQFGLDENDKYINSIIDQADADFDALNVENANLEGEDFYETLKIDESTDELDGSRENEDEVIQDTDDLLNIFGKKGKTKPPSKKKKIPTNKKKPIKIEANTSGKKTKKTTLQVKRASGKKKK